MKLKLPIDRLDDRRSLLSGPRSAAAGAGPVGAGHWSGCDPAAGVRYAIGGVADAFDFRKESPETIARYDTAPLVRPDQISRKWNNYDHYVDNASSLGKLLLLSRRLCERGCGFVTVTTSFVWDMHSDVNKAGVEEGMRYMGLPLDYAVSPSWKMCGIAG